MAHCGCFASFYKHFASICISVVSLFVGIASVLGQFANEVILSFFVFLIHLSTAILHPFAVVLHPVSFCASLWFLFESLSLNFHLLTAILHHCAVILHLF